MVFADHAFFTHDWNNDQHGRNNHARVRDVAMRCKAAGLKVWFDEDKMSGNIVDKMCEGIDDSAVVVVFVTKNYIEKVAQQLRADDNCKLEFNYALRRRKPTMMVAVVMEECVRSTDDWRGGVGMALGNHLYIDMSLGDTPAANKVDELVSTIQALIRNNGLTVDLSDIGQEIKKIETTVSKPVPVAPPSDAGKPHSLMSGYGNTYEGKVVSGTKQNGIGDFTCNSGSEKGNRYVGPFEGQTMVGTGTMYIDGGDIYEGERTMNGKKHGKGTYTWTNGNTYEGDWADGSRTGMGTFRWKDSGDHFYGEWVNSKRKGKGKYTWANGNYYDGMWDDDKMHGPGVEKFSDGVYAVEYNHGQRTKKEALDNISTPRDADAHTLMSGYGNTYEGKILSGTRQKGIGDFTCHSGSEKNNRYVGPFEGQTMTGRGTMYIDGGDIYEGERTMNGKKHGKGTYIWTNGNTYEGDWADGSRTGMGTFKWKDSGDHFYGEWVNSKRKGKGKYTWANGNYYDGNWDEDKMHGSGVEKFSDGLYRVEYNHGDRTRKDKM